MRKTWCSSKTDRTSWLSCWASASVVPNGFSMIKRTSAPSRRSSPRSPGLATITGKDGRVVRRPARELLDRLARHVAELVVGHLAARDAAQVEALGQRPVVGQVVDRRQQLAVR